MRIFLLVAVLVCGLSVHAEDAKRLVIIGDSLTEGYGVRKERAYPALLEKKIVASGKKWTVVNAGISGSTSASAPSRMQWQLKNKPDLIMLSLGANDGLRGLPVADMEKNLTSALELAKKENVKVILAGMLLPPNYGEAYVKNFGAAFKRVAEKNSVPLLPFILQGVGGIAKLNLSDGIHPNETGHEKVAETVYNFLKPYL